MAGQHGERAGNEIRYGEVLLDRYEFFDMIHRGEHSAVYLAYDNATGTRLAVKQYVGEGASERREKEARILGRLDHRSVVGLRGTFEAEGAAFVAKDRVFGYTLDVLTRETGPQAEEDVRQWMLTLCDVMEYLHAPGTGIVYADLKPSNVLLDAKRNLWLFDFDAAIEGCGDAGRAPELRMCTPGYTAPELVAPDWEVDRRADVYSAGALMWHLLAGQAPPDGFPLPDVRDANAHVCRDFAERVIPLCTRLDSGARAGGFSELRSMLLGMGPQRPEPYGGRRAVVGGHLLGDTPSERAIRDAHPTIILGNDGVDFAVEPIPEPTFLGDVKVGDILVLKESYFDSGVNRGRDFVVQRVERAPSSIEKGAFVDAYVCQGGPGDLCFRFYRWMVDFAISGEDGVSYSEPGRFVHLGTQRLETDRLVLRTGDMRDAEPMFRNWASDPEVVKYLTWEAYADVGGVRERIGYLLENYGRADFYDWFIELKETGEAIGSIGFTGFDEGALSFEVGYVIGRRWWGRGIAAEALSAVLEFAFDKVGARSVTARHDAENASSGRVMQKCGMTPVGTIPGGAENNRGVVDVCRYSISRNDHSAMSARKPWNDGGHSRAEDAKCRDGSAGRQDDEAEAPLPQEGDPLTRDFTNVLMQTASPPLGDDEEAWEWACAQLLRFYEAGFDEDLVFLLERSVLVNLTGAYSRHFEEFLELAGSARPVALTCESLLGSGDARKAKEVADPYYMWLLRHEELRGNGLLCFQGMIEASLYHLEYPEVPTVKTTEDNYSYFLVVYCRVLGSIVSESAQDADSRLATQRQALDMALHMSPCSFSVWSALANACTDDEEAFGECARQALRYCYQDGEPYGFGQIYADMALHYAMADQELGWALCEASKEHGGDPIGAMLVLSKLGYRAAPNGSWKDVLESHGVQVGVSDFCLRAIQVWEEYQESRAAGD